MFLLGAYGDALGAAHEGAGLSGKIGDPGSRHALPTLEEAGLEGPSPWGIWFDHRVLSPAQKGVVTDDTAFRVALLDEWVEASVSDGEPLTDRAFERWLRGRRARRDLRPEVEGARAEQVEDWIAMYDDIERYANGATEPSPGNPFFMKDVPVCFGLFQYLELAAWSHDLDTGAVMDRYRSFSRLDQGYGGQVTALAAGLLVEALRADPAKSPFGPWFLDTLRDLTTDAGFEWIEPHLEDAAATGHSARGFPPGEFLERLRAEVFQAPLPAGRDGKDLREFDPLLFLKLMTACVAYEPDGVAAVQLLSISVGDSDTMASELGSIVGAYEGAARLRERPGALADDLAAVEFVLLRWLGFCVRERSLSWARALTA